MPPRGWMDDPKIRGTFGAVAIMVLVVIAVAMGAGQHDPRSVAPQPPPAAHAATATQAMTIAATPAASSGLVITPMAAGLFIVLLLGALAWLAWRQNQLEARISRLLQQRDR
jgi:uncharacterized membrane protein YciS (DUF1049 family)